MKRITLLFLFILITNNSSANHTFIEQCKKSKKIALLKTVGGILWTAGSGLTIVASFFAAIDDREEIRQWLNPRISWQLKPEIEYLAGPIVFPCSIALAYVGYRIAKSGIQEIARYT